MARLGGDEFAILLDAADGLDDARGVADRISQAMLQPFYLAGVQHLPWARASASQPRTPPPGRGAAPRCRHRDVCSESPGKGRSRSIAAEFAAEDLGRLQLKAT